jgi:DMSO/TMAO reductase YedYZ molybdopterin-dependent catalytic subunit
LETYTLEVDGEVENPVKLGWNDFMKLPKTVSVSDFHCVEGWSVLDCKWEGVKIKDIEKLVKPKDVARWRVPKLIRVIGLSYFMSIVQA